MLSALQTSTAQTVLVDSGLDFGLIEFSSFHQGQLSIGTNGGAVLTGSGLYYQGGGVPAQMSVTGDSDTIEIRCNATGRLGGANGGALDIEDIEVSANVGMAPGAANQCAGTGGGATPAMVIDLSAMPNPRLLFGGTLDIPSGSLSDGGSFQSSLSGGSALTVSVVIQ